MSYTGMLDPENPIRPEFRHRYDVGHVTTARFMVDHIWEGTFGREFVVIDTAHPIHGAFNIVAVHGSLARASRKAALRNRIHQTMLHATAGMRRLGCAVDAHEAEPLDGWDELAFVRCVV